MTPIDLPPFFHYAAWSFYVEAQTLSGGDGFSRALGKGARVLGVVSVPPLCPADAAELRAFINKMQSMRYAVRLHPGDELSIPDLTEPFTDQTDFTDDSDFTDESTFDAPTFGGIDIDVVAGASTLTLPAGVTASLSVGCFGTIGAQTVRIVAVDGNDIEVRPRLRQTYVKGAPFAFGRVPMMFRLNPAEAPPVVNMLATRSENVVFSFEELYS